MRITKLELVNFRSYKDLAVDFEGGRTLIVGENGAGKSSIVDAISLALIGRCRGVNEKGDGQRDLIRTGQVEAKIRLTFDGHPTIERTIHQKHGATSNYTPDMISGALRTSKAMIAATVYGSTFFELHHSDAKSLLMRLLDVKVPVPGGDPIGLDEVDRYYDLAFQERGDLKRQLAGVGVPTVVEREDLVNLDVSDVAKLVGQAKDAYEQIAQSSADVRAKASALTQRVAALGRPAHGDEQTLKVKIDTHQGMADEHAKQMEDARSRLASGEAQPGPNAETLGARVHELRLFVQRVESVTVVPTSGKKAKSEPQTAVATCVLGAGIPCLTPAKEFQEALTRARADIRDLEASIKAGTAAAEQAAAVRQEFRSAEQNQTYHANQVVELKKQLDAERARVVELTAARTELDALRSSADDAEQALAAAKHRLNEATEQQLALVKYKAELKQRDEALSRRERLAALVAKSEEDVKRWGPKGVRMAALESSLKGFHSAINEALEPFGFTMRISVDPWEVQVRHGKTSAPVSFGLLSKGQRIWTGLAFQLALAKVSGLDFVIVDDVDGVVGSALQTLTGVIMASAVGQVLVVKAQADGQPMPTIDGLQTLRISEQEGGI